MSLSAAPNRVVIAGGSGFLGTSLARHLAERGVSPVMLSRRPPRTIGPWEYVVWDGRTLGDWGRAMEGASGLVNLAGRSVDCIKTPDHQDEILRSRVESTRVLGEAVRLAGGPPVWVQMSTAHIYGDPPEAVCTEDSAYGVGLAPQVATAWESAFQAGLLPTQRGVILRTSFVLGRDRGAGSGALAKLARVARLGLGGRIGHGRQGISWIHETDLNRLFERALTDAAMQGAYIASAPHPVSQAEFMRSLRRVVRMPVGLPVTPMLLRWGARWVLNTDPDLGLYGRYVVPQRLLDEGFTFVHPEIGPALQDLLG